MQLQFSRHAGALCLYGDYAALDRISIRSNRTLGVMPALVAGIRVCLRQLWKEDVDGRDSPGDDSRCSDLIGIWSKATPGIERIVSPASCRRNIAERCV